MQPRRPKGEDRPQTEARNPRMRDANPPERLDASGKPLPKSYCPDCGYGPIDSATGVRDENSRPEPGYVSLCLKCTAFLEFDEHLRLKIIPPAKWCELPEDIKDDLFRVRRAIHEMWLEAAIKKDK